MASYCEVRCLRNQERQAEKETDKELSIRDFTVRGIDTQKIYDPFEALVAVASVASQVLEEEEERLKKEKQRKKEKFVNMECSTSRHVGCGSGSDVSKPQLLIRESFHKKPTITSSDEFDNIYSKKVYYNNNDRRRKVVREKCEEEEEEGGVEDFVNNNTTVGSKREYVEMDDHMTASKKQRSTTGNNNKNSKKQKMKIPDHLEPPPPIPIELRDFIVNHLNGSDPVLVIQKPIFETDANNGHNRLSMPLHQIRDINVFTPNERRLLEQQVKLATIFVEPSLEICNNMGLKRWNMSKGIYALITEWNKFRERSGFKKGDIVQVWLFRVEGDDKIGLTVVKVGEAIEEGESSSDNRDGTRSGQRLTIDGGGEGGDGGVVSCGSNGS